MKVKIFFSILVIGGIGGAVASSIVLPYMARTNFLGSAVILGKFIEKSQVITQIEEKKIFVPRSEYFSDAIIASKNNVVAIQSFKKQKLLKTGNGIILTRDGLIATVKSAIALDADNFQVMLNGQASPAKMALTAETGSLVLISASGSAFEVARLEENPPELGRELLIFSRAIETGKDEPTIANTFVTQIKETGGDFKISGQFGEELSGSALIDGDGSILGILNLNKDKTEVIISRQVNVFFNNYLASKAE